jgi:hypothetical protein
MNLDVGLQTVSHRAVKSLFWKLLIGLLTFLLLFGSPLQFWLVSKEGDVVFDALYMFGFAIFMIDIVFNVYADPAYLTCDPCNRKLRKANPNLANHPQLWTFGFGSYNFWCDLISSVGFLYDISFINTAEFAMQTVIIELDRIGVPVCFFFNRDHFFSLFDNLFSLRLHARCTHWHRTTLTMQSTTHSQWSKTLIFLF